jgi:hypothetical protein
MEGSWAFVTYMLLIGRFVIPFYRIVEPRFKASLQTLVFTSVLVIFMHIIEIHWIVMPVFSDGGVSLSWLDFATFIGLGGIFMGLFFQRFKKHNIVPVNDPKLAESLNKHYHQ